MSPKTNFWPLLHYVSKLSQPVEEKKKKKKKEPSMFKHALNKTNEQGLYVPAIQYSACLQQQNRLYF